MEPIIYCKQMGGPRVPVTLNITWFATGKIEPCRFWTPDNTCFEVTHIYECVPLAFLKEQRMGLRFKVQIKAMETPELYQNGETYIYMEDQRFCEKSIVDGRYARREKLYVPVSMDVFPDGSYELTYFWVRGSRYQVEKTLDVNHRGAYRAGGVGLRHKVQARLVNENDDEDPDPSKTDRRMAAIFLEIDKWFMSVKA